MNAVYKFYKDDEVIDFTAKKLKKEKLLAGFKIEWNLDLEL